MSNISISIGEKRVRTNFNPSDSDVVSKIKQQTAILINLLEGLRGEDKDQRLISVAQTEYEGAAMWAVKAATS